VVDRDLGVGTSIACNFPGSNMTSTFLNHHVPCRDASFADNNVNDASVYHDDDDDDDSLTDTTSPLECHMKRDELDDLSLSLC